MTRPGVIGGIWVCALLATNIVGAAEIKFRAECPVTGAIVKLGDLAEISSAGDEEKRTLSELDLLPAPAAGKKRGLTSRQLQDLLVLRGVAVADHRFSGASQVTIVGSSNSAQPDKKQVSPVAARQAQTNVKQALSDYLASRLHGEVQLKFSLTDAQLARLGADVRVAGGAAPWVGMQNFEIRSGSQSFPLAVQVTQSPKVVISTVALPRGTIVQAADVQLQEGKPGDGNSKAYAALDDVIGKETTRNVAAGQALDDQMVRSPLVVRRGEVVDIIARSAGIRVRVKGRSRGDGALGDLVTVESVTDKKAFLARVCGAQEVEVFAQATVAETAAVSTAR